MKNQLSNDYKDLDFANGWNKTPSIVKECEKKGHHLRWKQLSPRGLSMFWCPKCKYNFFIDSSG